MGGGATFFDNLVEVRPLDPADVPDTPSTTKGAR